MSSAKWARRASPRPVRTSRPSARPSPCIGWTTSSIRTSDQGLKALVQQPADPTIRNWRKGGYIADGSQSLKDPWGNDYQYVYPGTHGHEYDLYSFGADGQEGGEGEDADVGNWNLDAKPATSQSPTGP